LRLEIRARESVVLLAACGVGPSEALGVPGELRFALCANAHISESRYGAPDFVATAGKEAKEKTQQILRLRRRMTTKRQK